MATNHETAQQIVYQINASSGAQPGESTRDLCLAIDPDVTDDVVELVERHRNSDGTFRAVVAPEDAGAKAKSASSSRSAH
jgi:hypothetical protein